MQPDAEVRILGDIECVPSAGLAQHIGAEWFDVPPRGLVGRAGPGPEDAAEQPGIFERNWSGQNPVCDGSTSRRACTTAVLGAGVEAIEGIAQLPPGGRSSAS